MSKEIITPITLAQGVTYADLNAAHEADLEDILAIGAEPGNRYAGPRESVIHPNRQAILDAVQLLTTRATQIANHPEIAEILPDYVKYMWERAAGIEGEISGVMDGMKEMRPSQLGAYCEEMTEIAADNYQAMSRGIVQELENTLAMKTFVPSEVKTMLESIYAEGFINRKQYEGMRHLLEKQTLLRIRSSSDKSVGDVMRNMEVALGDAEYDPECEEPPVPNIKDDYGQYSLSPPYTDIVDLMLLDPGNCVWIKGAIGQTGRGATYTLKRLPDGRFKVWATVPDTNFIRRNMREYPQAFPLQAIILSPTAFWMQNHTAFRGCDRDGSAIYRSYQAILTINRDGYEPVIWMPGVDRECPENWNGAEFAVEDTWISTAGKHLVSCSVVALMVERRGVS